MKNNSQDQNKAYLEWVANSPDEFRRRFIKSFIEHTIEYGKNHLKEKLQQPPSPEQAEEFSIRTLKWIGYLEFQNHALEEIETERLHARFFSGLDPIPS